MQYVAETLLADRLPAAPASPILASSGQVESQRCLTCEKTPELSHRSFRF
jgi:hypothetical protein